VCIFFVGCFGERKFGKIYFAENFGERKFAGFPTEFGF
jgi:hypothetical protein